ncbi:MAG: nucleotidyltransferase [Reichenbachiella sp.]|uniref:nucleotidyltransferase n=1 Tax=Reichenbachiella sp. TaxID=2184521 RepID=UPI0032644D96
MDINNPYYLEVLKSLNSCKVEYILVGGLAVGLHGYSRYTGDMDLWVNPTKVNINRLYRALLEMGYDKSVVESIQTTRDIENPTPIRLIEDDGVFKVDLMTHTFQKIYSFEECRNSAQMYESDGVSIPVVHINHLIKMKENTKRLDDNLKDLVDAQELKKIVKLQSKIKGQSL